MMQNFKSLALAGAFAVGSVVGASAGTLDLTDPSNYTISPANVASGTYLGVDWSLTAIGGNINDTEAYNGLQPVANPASAGLSFTTDGIGIVDDEVSYPAQELVLTFARSVQFTAIHFLDMFGLEGVDLYLDGSFAATLTAVEPGGDNTYGGYLNAAAPAPIWATVFRFVPTSGNDLGQAGIANPDFALAGLDIAQVPVPAGGILLLTALGGLAAVRRRKA